MSNKKLVSPPRDHYAPYREGRGTRDPFFQKEGELERVNITISLSKKQRDEYNRASEELGVPVSVLVRQEADRKVSRIIEKLEAAEKLEKGKNNARPEPATNES